LLVDVRTTVDDGRTHPGAVRKFASLVVDLGNKLASGRKDEGSGERLAGTRVAKLGVGLLRRGTGALSEGRRKDGEKETACFPRAGLSVKKC
jgi:hypothetical protein